MRNWYHIGEISALFQVPVETLRYYDRERTDPAGTGGGKRIPPVRIHPTGADLHGSVLAFRRGANGGYSDDSGGGFSGEGLAASGCSGGCTGEPNRGFIAIPCAHGPDT